MKISYPLATVLEIVLPEHVGPKAVQPDLEFCSGAASEQPWTGDGFIFGQIEALAREHRRRITGRNRDLPDNVLLWSELYR